MQDTRRTPRPYWHPAVAGIALGLVLLLTFFITGHGVGGSGFFARLAAAVSGWIAPVWSEANGYFGPFLTANPLAAWITWEIVGVVIGAFAGAVTSGRFRAGVERGPGIGAPPRLAFALAGGILTGFGARLARGCTSGLGMSGSATLAVAGFLFLAMFFLAGFVVSRAMRREWV